MYQFPRDRNLTFLAKDFVQNCLHTNPESRPTARSLALHPFLALGGKTPSPLHLLFGITKNEVQFQLAEILSTSIVKYCDQRAKLGLGYFLLNGTIGAIFPEGSRMVMDSQRGVYAVLHNRL
jgi:serine/threonine protein kinase